MGVALDVLGVQNWGSGRAGASTLHSASAFLQNAPKLTFRTLREAEILFREVVKILVVKIVLLPSGEASGTSVAQCIRIEPRPSLKPVNFAVPRKLADVHTSIHVVSAGGHRFGLRLAGHFAFASHTANVSLPGVSRERIMNRALTAKSFS